MGVCASSPTTEGRIGTVHGTSSTIKVIHADGRLQEFKQPIIAGHVLSENQKTFLCKLDTMEIDSYMPHVPETEELQLGQIYFLMPLSKSQCPLSLSDLCVLAIKASTVLQSKHYLSKQLSTGNSFERVRRMSVSGDRNGLSNGLS